MKANIEELITLNYELEGLLYLALHRGDDTPAQVWSMIGEKINALREGLPETAGTTEPTMQASEIEPVAPVEEETPELDPLPMPEHHDLATETPDEILTVIKEEEAEAAEAAPEEEPNIAPGPIYEMEPEPIATPEPVKIPEPEKEPEAVVIPEPVVEEHKTAPVQPKAVDAPATPATEGPSVLRLDEKLARAYSRDLKKAFSLNDRFRFRRELFGNSDTMMTDTLNLVEAMPSYSEALDYFYTDLEWDRTMPEVIEFLKIIEQHFQGK